MARNTFSLRRLGVVTVMVLVVSLVALQAGQPSGAVVPMDADDIAGVVTGPNGPEAGVWVIAETDDWVAMGSEYRALAGLPGVEKARIWEPEPEVVYAWSR